MNASGSSSQGRRGRKPPAESGAEPIVTTTGGQVRGLTAPGGYVFRGLPYAAPPIGDLPWRPPRQPADWQGVRDATVFGPIKAHVVIHVKVRRTPPEQFLRIFALGSGMLA